MSTMRVLPGTLNLNRLEHIMSTHQLRIWNYYALYSW